MSQWTKPQKNILQYLVHVVQFIWDKNFIYFTKVKLKTGF